MAQNWISDFTNATLTSDFWQETENGLNALRTNFSGSSAPSTSAAFSTYVNTTSKLLYRRNSADTGYFISQSVDSDRVITKTADYSVVVGDFSKTILVDCSAGDVTISLLAAATAGEYWWCTIKRTDASDNDVIIDANGSETIDGEPTITLSTQYDFYRVQSDNSNYHTVGQSGGGSSASVFGTNFIINGAFEVAQDGTSFSGTTAKYTYDQWKITTNSGGSTYSISRSEFAAGQSDVTPNPKYYVDIDVTSGSNTKDFFNVLEDVNQYSGKTMTLSFWAKSSANSASAFKFYIRQNFGSGGSSAILTESTTQAITNMWALYSYTFTVPSTSGKTVGAGNYMEVGIEMLSSYQDVFSITAVKFEEGAVATTYVNENITDTLLKCHRYYWKISTSFSTIQAAGTNNSAQPVYSYILNISFNVPMRSTPSVSHNVSGYSANVNTFCFRAFTSGSISYNTQTQAIYWANPTITSFNSRL